MLVFLFLHMSKTEWTNKGFARLEGLFPIPPSGAIAYAWNIWHLSRLHMESENKSASVLTR
jgi:hypothetical protein